MFFYYDKLIILRIINYTYDKLNPIPKHKHNINVSKVSDLVSTLTGNNAKGWIKLIFSFSSGNFSKINEEGGLIVIYNRYRFTIFKLGILFTSELRYFVYFSPDCFGSICSLLEVKWALIIFNACAYWLNKEINLDDIFSDQYDF